MAENIFPETRKTRMLTIELKFKNEGSKILAGDEAQRFLQAYTKWSQGEIVQSVNIGREFIHFSCLCGVEIQGQAIGEEENPQKCESIDCLPDYNVNAEQ